MLEVKNAKMMYGNLVAVSDLSFTLKEGEILGLLGTNGAGKTTTFRMIMGLLKPVEGSITYNGGVVGYHNVNEIGYMIEERSLLTKITVRELLQYFGQLKDLSVEVIDKRMDYWLNRFEITSYRNRKIKELSKGNQQKIQFISAIINNPKLLILDEPFSGLDIVNVDMFVSAIRDLQKEGTMIIFSSHQIDHVESFCEKVVILEKGKNILSGDVKEIKKGFEKHRISIVADISEDDVKDIKGVYQVTTFADRLEVKIENENIAKLVFEVVKKANNVKKFDVEEATLGEIFKAKIKQEEEK